MYCQPSLRLPKVKGRFPFFSYAYVLVRLETLTSLINYTPSALAAELKKSNLDLLSWSLGVLKPCGVAVPFLFSVRIYFSPPVRALRLFASLAATSPPSIIMREKAKSKGLPYMLMLLLCVTCSRAAFVRARKAPGRSFRGDVMTLFGTRQVGPDHTRERRGRTIPFG